MVTDRTQGCPACSIRLRASAPRCPSCGGELRKASAAARMGLRRQKQGLERRERRLSLAWTLLVRGGPPVAVFALAWASSGRASHAFAWSLLALPYLVFLQLFVPSRQKSARNVVAASLSLPADDVPGPTGTRVTGTVVALGERGIVGPLSGAPCVAFRLQGRVGDSEVDDAAAAPFALVADDGRRWRVRPDVAAVSIEPDGPPCARPLPVSKPLLAFLAGLGIDADLATHVVLAEARVEAGARVTVSGQEGEEVDPAGVAEDYRAPPTSRTLTGSSEAPMWIERLRAGPG